MFRDFYETKAGRGGFQTQRSAVMDRQTLRSDRQTGRSTVRFIGVDTVSKNTRQVPNESKNRLSSKETELLTIFGKHNDGSRSQRFASVFHFGVFSKWIFQKRFCTCRKHAVKRGLMQNIMCLDVMHNMARTLILLLFFVFPFSITQKLCSNHGHYIKSATVFLTCMCVHVYR